MFYFLLLLIDRYLGALIGGMAAGCLSTLGNNPFGIIIN
jgi:hypothetical protein